MVITGKGIQLKSVSENRIGHQSDLRAGDVLVTVNGVAVNSSQELSSALQRVQSKQSYSVGFSRDGSQNQSVNVAAGKLGLQTISYISPLFAGVVNDKTRSEPSPKSFWTSFITFSATLLLLINIASAIFTVGFGQGGLINLLSAAQNVFMNIFYYAIATVLVENGENSVIARRNSNSLGVPK
jgi:membrane-associated protease RseP (regulator of RpoE activity)